MADPARLELNRMLKHELESLRTENSNLKKNAKGNDNNKNNMNSNNKNENFKDNNNNSKTDQDGVTQNLCLINRSFNDLKEERQTLEKKSNSVSQQNREIQRTLNAASADLAESRKESQRKDDEIEKLKRRCAQVEAEADQAQNGLDEANQVIASKNEDLQSMASSMRFIQQKSDEKREKEDEGKLEESQKARDHLLNVIQSKDEQREKVKTALDQLQAALIEKEEKLYKLRADKTALKVDIANVCKVMKQQNESLLKEIASKQREIDQLRGEKNSKKN